VLFSDINDSVSVSGAQIMVPKNRYKQLVIAVCFEHVFKRRAYIKTLSFERESKTLQSASRVGMSNF
jgi:hypothetical protein